MEIEFPLEFLVRGTPVSLQAKRSVSRDEWKERVKEASKTALPQQHFVSKDAISVTLFYFPPEAMQGDVDNIVKLVLDACSRHIFVDDSQIERIVVQKFEPQNIFPFSEPTRILEDALSLDKPVLYVRISNDPFEELT